MCAFSVQDSELSTEYRMLKFDATLFKKGTLIAHAFLLEGDEWEYFVGYITVIRKSDDAKWIRFEDGEHIKVSTI